MDALCSGTKDSIFIIVAVNGNSNGVKGMIDLISNDSLDSKVKDQNENDVDHDMDSDGENGVGGGVVVGVSGANGVVVGPTTRRAWSDWCSSRGKSSKENSEDDTQTGGNGTTSSVSTRNQRKTTPLTRGKKKVLRKKSARSKVSYIVKNHRNYTS